MQRTGSSCGFVGALNASVTVVWCLVFGVWCAVSQQGQRKRYGGQKHGDVGRIK
jgi:hypothetical protein